MRSEMTSFNVSPVKSEEDAFDDQELRQPASKRSKLSMTTSSSPQFHECGFVKDDFPVPPTEYNPLDEPSPLGLRLKKSPSLLELIQMRLSQGSASSMAAVLDENHRSADKKDARGATSTISTEKLKASNFVASLLRIGCWEFVSRYEGDLVAKCYYAKHKLVWEILQGGLKIKMEIQWADIMALRANCPDSGPGTLIVVLSRPPVFCRESNPQPRKHTLWQTSPDFTHGQASIHGKHYLEFPPGVLNKHYEKLIQCDARLHFLSQQPETVLESTFFTRDSHQICSDELRANGSRQFLSGKASPVSCLSDVLSPSITEMSSVNYEQMDTASSLLSKETPSPSSVLGTSANEGNGISKHSDSGVLKKWEQLKVPGLRPSISMTDLVNHIGNCISEQVMSGNIPTDRASECQDILENISQVLLSDTQYIAASDEKSLMKRVNSLWSLLQDPAAPCSMQVNDVNHLDGSCSGRDDDYTQHPHDLMHESRMNGDAVSSTDPSDSLSSKQTLTISRKDSFGDLFLQLPQLPRIASLSKFLFDIAEDGESEAK